MSLTALADRLSIRRRYLWLEGCAVGTGEDTSDGEPGVFERGTQLFGSVQRWRRWYSPCPRLPLTLILSVIRDGSRVSVR